MASDFAVQPALQPRRLSLKARDRDPQGLRSRLEAIGAEAGAEVTQRDTYFQGPRGQVRLREEPSQAELFFYERLHLVGGPEPRTWRFEVAQPETVLEAFTGSLGIEAVVVKRRHTFSWERVRVHADAVQGLGSFVELDVPAGDGSGSGAGEPERRLATLRALLEIDARDLVGESYCELAQRLALSSCLAGS